MHQELNQQLFDNLFSDIRWEQAISLLLGDQKLSNEQQAALDLASKDREETFVPMPITHIGFQVRSTGNNPNQGPLVIVPGNQLIRRRINAIRRSDLAASLNIICLCSSALDFLSSSPYIPSQTNRSECSAFWMMDAASSSVKPIP